MSENTGKINVLGIDTFEIKLDIVFDNQEVSIIAYTELTFEKLIEIRKRSNR